MNLQLNRWHKKHELLILFDIKSQVPVVKSIVSFTSSLRGQVVKYFMTLLANTLISLIFSVEKMRVFALQKLLAFFQFQIMGYFRHLPLKF